jgi:membrane-associated phospholipid phosphatase
MGSVLVADALIRHREGIVGTWAPAPSLAPPFPLLDDPLELEQWEPWVRAATIDFDLVSHLTFSVASATASATVSHVEITGAAAATVTPIATIVRPPQKTFADQLTFLDQYADLREDRASEILAQLGPAVAFWTSVANLHPTRTRWTLELLDAILRLCNYVEMRFKHALACPRPIAYSPQVQPIILTPGHGTLPSGHATESFAVASVLSALRGGVPALADQLHRQAARIAINRTVAGVHFPVDTAAGYLLGDTLAEYFIARATTPSAGPAQPFTTRMFDGSKFPGSQDFDPRKALGSVGYYVDVGAQNGVRSELLAWLWAKAASERF